MSELADIISNLKESMNQVNRTIADSHQTIDDSYSVLAEPITDPGSRQIVEQLQQDSSERLKNLDTLTQILISQVRALDRTAAATEKQVQQLHDLVGSAREQVVLAKQEAAESAKQAKHSRVHAILSLVFAGFSAFAAVVYPLISPFLSSP